MPAIPSKPERPLVGIWAGSSPSTPREIKNGLARLDKLGFETVIPPEVRRNWTRKESAARPFLAGPDADKVRALAKLWKDPRITTILPVRGGYGTQRLLEGLDRVLKAPTGPKRIWGFSDLTTVQNWLWSRFGQPWVHSPMLSSAAFAKPSSAEKTPWELCLDPFREGEEIEHSLRVANLVPGRRRVQGPILGGNLASFVSLLGTRFEPKPRGDFLFFIEEVEEYPRRIDRWLNQLSSSRFFRRCRGVVLGHMTECKDGREIVRLWAKENKILLVEGLKAGHEHPNVPVSMGVKAHLEVQKNGKASLRVPILPFE